MHRLLQSPLLQAQKMNKKTAREILSETNLDSILISSWENIAYLINYFGFSKTDRDGFFFSTKRRCYLITNSLYKNAFLNNKELKILTTDSSNSLQKLLAEIIAEEKIKTLGFEDSDLTVKEYARITGLKLDLVSVDISDTRVIKTEDEIKKIKMACFIADSALKETKKLLRPGISEKEFCRLLEVEIRKMGGEIAFPTIVAFGENSATPHHHTGEKKLKENDVALIDFGASFENYLSDMTRTFFIGNTTAEQKKAYQVVLEAQKKAVQYIELSIKNRTPVLASQADKIARDYIISEGYPTIPHSLGHGIGINVHEPPSLSPFSKEELKEGMVFSIEPGIYISGKFGVRIEDLYVLREAKLEQITSFPS